MTNEHREKKRRRSGEKLMAKALFKTKAMGARQARACLRHNRRETTTESIRAVETLVTEKNEELVYGSYDDLCNALKRKKIKPHGNAKFFREAIVTLESRHSLGDLRELGKKIKKELDYSTLYYFIHRDEGYTAVESGKFIQNLHAHIGYTTLNFKTGRVNPHGREQMQALQAITADVLQMEPGVPVSQSKVVGLDHRAWRRLKELETELESTKSELHKAIQIRDINAKQHQYAEKSLESPLAYLLTRVSHASKVTCNRKVREAYLNSHIDSLNKAILVTQSLRDNDDELPITGSLSNTVRFVKNYSYSGDGELARAVDSVGLPPSIGDWESHDSLKSYPKDNLCFDTDFEPINTPYQNTPD